jgi:hypothetical protein
VLEGDLDELATREVRAAEVGHLDVRLRAKSV